MVSLIAHILVSALGLLLAARLVSGIEVINLYTALIAALILGLLNSVVRPILVILTLPINILTLGLFTFVINAGLFLFAASFIEGFAVDGFWVALLGSVIVSVVNSLGSKFIK